MQSLNLFASVLTYYWHGRALFLIPKTISRIVLGWKVVMSQRAKKPPKNSVLPFELFYLFFLLSLEHTATTNSEYFKVSGEEGRNTSFQNESNTNIIKC